jgi:hypothetical protein
MGKISKYIVSIIVCHRPEARIERGWEAVCLSIADEIVIVIGCSRPGARLLDEQNRGSAEFVHN